jgi:tetratricopeptide (TPR) repeat protein
MKLKMSFVCLFVVAALLAVVSTNAQTTNTDFQQAVAVYQKSHSRDDAEKVIKMVAAMDQPPPIPEAAMEHFVMGQTIFKAAKNTNDFSMAGQEFIQAVRVAPWWPEARYNFALTLEASGNYSGAIADLKLYQEFKPPEAEARAVQNKIYVIQAKQKMAENDKASAEKAAKDAAAKAQESSPETVAAKKQNTVEDWLKKLDGARYAYSFRDDDGSIITWNVEISGKTLTLIGPGGFKWCNCPIEDRVAVWQMNPRQSERFKISDETVVETLPDGTPHIYNRVR